MKLLKSFGGEEVEMKVVSLLDSTSSMVSASIPGGRERVGEATGGGGPWGCQAPCLPPVQYGRGI